MWWITISLILAGILLMLVEFLLIPGVGIAGIFSIAAFAASCWYSFVTFGSTAGWTVTVIVILLLVAMLCVILRGKTWKRFELKTEIDTKTNVDVENVHVGDRGRAGTRLAPMGTGVFDKVSCEVKSHGNAMVDAGTPIEVIDVRDNQVLVKPIND